ncbi:MAG: filamentation induced by cAMP protein fic [Marinobacter sp. T13-3]|nr:MAG: filamentation induced by cAMP protein fic [Marinobacter sp. T13-3]
MPQATDTHWLMTPNRDKALMLAQKAVSVFVYDAVQLEGINFTLPEVQTLLQVRIPANVTGHSGDRDRFAHGHHAGVSFVL